MTVIKKGDQVIYIADEGKKLQFVGNKTKHAKIVVSEETSKIVEVEGE